MLRHTVRQALTDVLLKSYVIHRYAEFFAVAAREVLAIDDEDDDEQDDDDKGLVFFINDLLLQCLKQIHSTRYLETCIKIPKSAENLYLILTEYKTNWPKIFWCFVRVSPQTFDSNC
jgi:hypothetical protein